MNGKFLNSLLAGAALAGATAFSDLDAVPVKNNKVKTTAINKAKPRLMANTGWNVPLSDFIETTTIPFIKQWEGKVLDKKGNHIVYDDYIEKGKPRRVWDGLGGNKGLEKFIESCKGRPAIGYGDNDVDFIRSHGGKITENEATDLLRTRIIDLANDLTNQFSINGMKRLNGVPGKAGMFTLLSPNQKTALISFHYNLGPKFMLTKTKKMKAAFQKGDWANVCYEMRDCNKSNGKEVKGLTRRRNAEMELWNTPWN